MLRNLFLPTFDLFLTFQYFQRTYLWPAFHWIFSASSKCADPQPRRKGLCLAPCPTPVLWGISLKSVLDRPLALPQTKASEHRETECNLPQPKGPRFSSTRTCYHFWHMLIRKQADGTEQGIRAKESSDQIQALSIHVLVMFKALWLRHLTHAIFNSTPWSCIFTLFTSHSGSVRQWRRCGTSGSNSHSKDNGAKLV